MTPPRPPLSAAIAAASVSLTLLATAAPAVASDTSGPRVRTATVTTDNETPALFDDDLGGKASGDDPAIWVHPKNSHRSLVIVTAKEGGLRVYDMKSKELQALKATAAPRKDGVAGRFNNVDIAYGVKIGNRRVDVAVVSDRYNDQLRFFAIDPTGARSKTPLREITAPEQPFLFSADRATVTKEHTAYGLAVYQPRRGPAQVVVTQEGATALATVRIVEKNGKLGYAPVGKTTMPDSFRLPDRTTWTPCEEPGTPPQFEGASVDQRSGVLYAAQEDVGLWRIPLPLGSRGARLVDTVRDFGIHETWDAKAEECKPINPNAKGFGGRLLTADAEGVDIYYGPRGKGYVIVSGQGDDSFVVYSREGRNAPLGTFKVKGVKGVDDIHGSDGLAVTNRPVGDYRRGLLVTHDEPETGPGLDPKRDVTNFSYVQWREIAKNLRLESSTREDNDPRF